MKKTTKTTAKKRELLEKLEVFDRDNLIKMFNSLVKQQSNDSPEDLQYRSELLRKIRNSYYTFRPSAKGKKFSFLKSIVYRQLFKYLHRQIHFNDYIRTAIEIHEQDIQQVKKDSNRFDKQFDVVLNNIKVIEREKYGDHFQKATSSGSLDDVVSVIGEINNRLNAIAEIQRRQLLKKNDRNLSQSSKISYSQFGEDQWIVNNLIIPKKGYFIDVGAADGITHSNTYYFEKIGWSGICFEPNPENFTLANNFRNNVNQLAISSSEGKMKFIIANESPDWSRLQQMEKSIDLVKDEVIEVSTKSLNSVVKEHKIKNIDLLSIDTEGTEIDVLDSLDFKKIKPKIIIIEYLAKYETDNSEKIIRYFKNLPYKLAYKTKANLILTYE